MSDIDLEFEKIFKIAVISLRINGSYPSIIRNKLWALHFSFVFSINILCFYLLCNSIFIHDIRNGNFNEACKNISITIISMNTNIKYMVLLYHQQSIVELIDIVNHDYKLAKKFAPEEQHIVKHYAKRGVFICRLWCACASSASAVFPFKAFFSTAHSFWIGENELTPMFDITFPRIIENHKDSSAPFWGIFALCLVFAFFTAVMFIGCDPLIPIFTLHTCGQLDLLSRKMSTALSDAATVGEREENLKKIIIKLQDLYTLVNRVQINFKVLNEFNMRTTTIVLPLVSFHIVEDILADNTINYEFFTMLFGAALHFLMPCYYGDLLMERSAAFRQAIYSCGWEKYPNKRIRQTVLFMLTRASRPLGISTIFYNLSLDTFANMMRQAYSLFNLMNAAWAK